MSALDGYYAEARGESAATEKLLERLAAAQKEGARLKEMVARGTVPPEADGPRGEEATASDDEEADKDEDSPSKATEQSLGEEDPTFDAVLADAARLKEEGNAHFAATAAATSDFDRRSRAADAAISYLDALDDLHAARPNRPSRRQAEACEALELSLLLNRAAALNRQDEWRLSLKASNAALVKAPRSSKALYRRAVALSGLGRDADAEGDLLELLRHDAKNRDARTLLAAVKKRIRETRARKAGPF